MRTASIHARRSSTDGDGRPCSAATVRMRSPARPVNHASSAIAASNVAVVPTAGVAAAAPAPAPKAPSSRANESVSAFIFSGRTSPPNAAARPTAASHRELLTRSMVTSMVRPRRSMSAGLTRMVSLSAHSRAL